MCVHGTQYRQFILHLVIFLLQTCSILEKIPAIPARNPAPMLITSRVFIPRAIPHFSNLHVQILRSTGLVLTVNNHHDKYGREVFSNDIV